MTTLESFGAIEDILQLFSQDNTAPFDKWSELNVATVKS